MSHFYLVAGEQSGDLHGASLIRALGTNHSYRGVPGPEMRGLGVVGCYSVEDFAVMGFTDVLKSLPRLIRQFFYLRADILATAPDAVILIDYPGFNLRLARSLRRKGFAGKIFQFISPTVWAHGRGRIQTLERYFDGLLTIYPFEADFYKSTSLPVRYIGNPLAEQILLPEHAAPREKRLVGLFPGSRLSEIENNLPTQLAAASKLVEMGFTIALSVAHERLIPKIREHIAHSGFVSHIELVKPKDRYTLMRRAEIALASSGTVTLELALHQTPTVVQYLMSPLNRFIAQYVLRLKLPYFCIVNILAKEELFPELIREKATPERVVELAIQLYEKRDACRNACLEIRELLTMGHSADLAADQINRWLTTPLAKHL